MQGKKKKNEMFRKKRLQTLADEGRSWTFKLWTFHRLSVENINGSCMNTAFHRKEF